MPCDPAAVVQRWLVFLIADDRRRVSLLPEDAAERGLTTRVRLQPGERRGVGAPGDRAGQAGGARPVAPRFPVRLGNHAAADLTDDQSDGGCRGGLA